MNSTDRAIALLDDLDHRGITAEVRDNELYLKPRSLVEPEILEALRSVKADVIRRVLLREAGADREDPETYLITRLRSGQTWLDDELAELESMPYGGLGTTLNTRFVHGLDTWLRLEGTLRFAVHYTGCIHAASGESCPDGTAAPCRACTGMAE